MTRGGRSTSNRVVSEMGKNINTTINSNNSNNLNKNKNNNNGDSNNTNNNKRTSNTCKKQP